MAKSFAISSADLNKAVYTAIASAKQDPALDVLAGVTCFMLLEDPALTKENILKEVIRFQEVITSNSTELHGAHDALYVSRLLTKIAPSIDDGSALQKGFRNYTLEFYKSYRQGVELFRQVESIESQSDQFDKADRFRRMTWERLFKLSSGNQVMASAINESQISVALGFEITDDAQTQLQKVSIPSLSDFISANPTTNGQLQTDITDIENRLALLSNEALELDTLFANNIIALNKAEQNLRDKRSIKALKAGKKEGADQDDKEEQTELEKAIKFAEEKQKELDKILNKTRSGLKTTLDVFAFIAAHGNDEEFAEDIKLFNEASIASLDAFRKY